MPSGLSLAREIAYDAFTAVMDNDARPEEVLDELYRTHEKQLKRLDRNFIKEIVFGGLRWYSKIYWILQNTASRNLDDVPAPLRTALVLGTYQIFYMDRVPDRAAVNESVEYVRKKGLSHACSFVNGILRQIARRAEYFAKPDKVTKQAEYLALQFAHPKWIVDRWLNMFKFERLEGILSNNNQQPPVTIRVNAMKTDLKDVIELQQVLLRDEKTHSDRRPLRSAMHLKESPRLDTDSLFGKGFYTIQDEASQLIGNLVMPSAGQKIVDACAGPGGKLSHIYEMTKGDVKLTGIEKKPKQMERIKQNLERLQMAGVNLVETDFLTWQTSEKADKILLDAPCSGLGVLHRHPEGKWQKTEAAIKTMAELQRQLIKKALEVLKPGGELIYSVCSFEPEEGVDHIGWLKKEYRDKIRVISPVSRLPDYYKKYVTRENVLLIYAGNQDFMDGFSSFIVSLAPT